MSGVWCVVVYCPPPPTPLPPTAYPTAYCRTHIYNIGNFFRFNSTEDVAAALTEHVPLSECPAFLGGGLRVGGDAECAMVVCPGGRVK
jgi:hypothetical protein